ncbi:19171_t:CDS:10 [Dentiscutata erythropus]|uniref:19171_t:CDS:1 n=1 Tax=Dentiscutata erythropus TaxID=1348616 RepID=A0A9N8ZX63_9GLOM|nr:19171_t:CDS:10 [Dentiscutata erythropus]
MACRLPFGKLLHHLTRNLLILVYGSHFQALDTSTGAIIASTRTLYSDNTDTIPQIKYITPTTDGQEASIRAIAFHNKVDGDGSLLASSGEDKLLKVWDIKEWRLLSSRPVPKRVVSIALSEDGSQIVTADKFGDVYSYPTNPPEHIENTSTLLLGHVSMVTDMVLTPNNKFVITADRDEHIRVSQFPKGYNIESYCFGHTQFLSKLHILPWDSDLLLSAGGDDFIALWDYVPGRLIQTLDIKNFIQNQIIEANESNIDDIDAMNNVPESKNVAVMSISSSTVMQHIAIIIEKFPGVLILNWDAEQRHVKYMQTLSLNANPLDCAYDLQGNLWVSSSSRDDGNIDEGLITLFLRRDNNKYEKGSTDHPLVYQINKFGSMKVDILPDLYTTSQLRKDPTDWRKQNNKHEDEEVPEEASEESTNESTLPKKNALSKGDSKRKKKRIKTE